ncbi:diheme cytochrome c-553 [Runella sp.]|jgi:hypothetical protein|uniref:diheme cytochrome c-553 n=1 Tax=Runella sp. TaxID=1960881 RepID=UPI00263237FB|nr:diheme cytochrome c-553 [Runella sp.]
MKTQLISLSVMAFAGAMFLSSFNKAEPPKKTKLADDALIKKGEYLVGILGCGDCHAPKMMTSQGPAPDPALGLSGHPSAIPMPKVNKEALKDWALFFPTLTMSVGPWGASFAANITPDATGIGSWTYEQFKIAMTQGKSKGIATARPLLPPMPWQNYVNMKDEDLRAVFAYLKSCKPIHNVIPQPISPDKL